MSAPHLRPVDPSSFPEYPPELSDPDLTRGYFMMFWHRRWLSSRLCLTASMAVQGAALNLYAIAQEQIPVGSLPADHKLLARLLRVSDGEWQSWMSEPVTPLHGWQEYVSGDDIVFGHPVVIEVALAAAAKREERRLSSEDRAIAKRRERLAVQMREVGCSEKVCSDSALVAWLDEWLVSNHVGQRRRPHVDVSIERGLRVAFTEGKFKGG